MRDGRVKRTLKHLLDEPGAISNVLGYIKDFAIGSGELDHDGGQAGGRQDKQARQSTERAPHLPRTTLRAGASARVHARTGPAQVHCWAESHVLRPERKTYLTGGDARDSIHISLVTGHNPSALRLLESQGVRGLGNSHALRIECVASTSIIALLIDACHQD